MPPPDPFIPGATPFEGIPRRNLPEDCVEYVLFAISATLTTPPLVQQRLEEVRSAASALVQQHASEYIWQRESFHLHLDQIDEAGRNTWHLRGRTEYGDAVDDEWFIVWMLREISKKFPDLWIRVYDTDGEFLLIEAANVLPRWLNPEITLNRVWINSGKLYIIPLSSTGAAPGPLTLSEALAIISACHPDSLTRIRLVEEEAFFRTASYPSAAQSHLHHALVRVPRHIAGILHRKPASVSPATEAFYLRDPVSLRSLKSLKWEESNNVIISVKFTKVLYAQLRGQVWEPSFTRVTEGDTITDVGAKLTAGFHMLLEDQSSPVATALSRRKFIQELQEIRQNYEPPTSEEIATWEKKVDSDDWLNIDFSTFEEALAGKGKGEQTQGPSSGWGDKEAEKNLKKMVERFESFLNDEGAGLEGAELTDEMDEDDDEDDTDEESDNGEEKDISFDENEFSRMMREMMGFPSDPNQNSTDSSKEKMQENELKEIMETQEQIEAELKAAGALRSEKPRISQEHDANEEENDEVNIDYNLAKNLLESFKGQGGLAGPGGNLLARMGIVLPRDEEDN